jgi:hypothetical protein
MPAVAASTNATPMIASWISGQRLSVQCRIDEDDSAAQDFRAERDVCAEHQQARNECGEDDAQLELAH